MMIAGTRERTFESEAETRALLDRPAEGSSTRCAESSSKTAPCKIPFPRPERQKTGGTCRVQVPNLAAPSEMRPGSALRNVSKSHRRHRLRHRRRCAENNAGGTIIAARFTRVYAAGVRRSARAYGFSRFISFSHSYNPTAWLPKSYLTR